MIIISTASRRRAGDVAAVFVDSVAWIARVNTRDALFAATRRVFNSLERQRAMLVTTEFVFLEVADALSSPPLRARSVAFLNGLRQHRNLEIVPVSGQLYNAGWTLYGQRPDKEWSLTDCISFALMTERGLTDAFTSDHHFEQAGFLKLL
jgi:predicted nucleic acid-binding protein